MFWELAAGELYYDEKYPPPLPTLPFPPLPLPLVSERLLRAPPPLDSIHDTLFIVILPLPHMPTVLPSSHTHMHTHTHLNWLLFLSYWQSYSRRCNDNLEGMERRGEERRRRGEDSVWCDIALKGEVTAVPFFFFFFSMHCCSASFCPVGVSSTLGEKRGEER